MNGTAMPKTLQSPSLKIITNLVSEEINGGIALEGPRDLPLGLEGSWYHLDLSEVKIDKYFEFEDEDEQGYVREGEELEQSLTLVMEDQMDGGIQGWEECKGCTV